MLTQSQALEREDRLGASAHKAVCISIVVVMLFESLGRLGLAPSAISNIVEAWSALLFVAVILALAKGTRFVGAGKYFVLAFFFVVLIFSGAVANGIDTGSFINGFRHYFKYAPIFMLPLLFRFKDEQLIYQFKLIFFFVALQAPLAVYQKWVLGVGWYSGDIVKGTFETGGHQAVFLFSVTSFLVVGYVRNVISLPYLTVLMLLALFPNFLNETKSSMFFLPIALLVPIMLMKNKRKRKQVVLKLMLPGAAFAIIFLAFYQVLYVEARQGGEFETTADIFSWDYISNYLGQANEEKGKYGRFAKIAYAFDVLSKEPTTLAFGLGVGNTSPAIAGGLFEGEYYDEYSDIKGATIGFLLFDIGFIGLALFFTLIVFIAKDAAYLSKFDGIYGAIGQALVAVMILVIVSSTYRALMEDNAIGYLFAYYSGIVISQAHMRRVKRLSPYSNKS